MHVFFMDLSDRVEVFLVNMKRALTDLIVLLWNICRTSSLMWRCCRHAQSSVENNNGFPNADRTKKQTLMLLGSMIWGNRETMSERLSASEQKCNTSSWRTSNTKILCQSKTNVKHYKVFQRSMSGSNMHSWVLQLQSSGGRSRSRSFPARHATLQRALHARKCRVLNVSFPRVWIGDLAENDVNCHSKCDRVKPRPELWISWYECVRWLSLVWGI